MLQSPNLAVIQECPGLALAMLTIYDELDGEVTYF